MADVGFTSDRYSTVAGNSQVSLQVRRDAPGAAITINYRTVAGSAIPGTDYVNQPAGTVTIPADSTGPSTISIPLLFNSSVQTRSFAVELTATSGDVLSGFVRADVQILGSDDQANKVGVIRFPVVDGTVEADDLYVLSVSRENGSKGSASVRLRTQTTGEFDPIDQVLTWADGEVGVKTVPVHATTPFLSRTLTITVPIEMVNVTGAVSQGSTVATVYFLSTQDQVPVAARFIYASQILGAATSGISVPVSVPVDPDDDDTKLGYSALVRGVTTDVLEVRDYVAEGDGSLTIDDNGSATIEVTFPSLSIADRQIEMRLYRYGLEIDRTTFTLLGTATDPAFRPGGNLNTGIFYFLGSETRLNANSVAITTHVTRVGPTPLGAAALQYRLTAEDGVSGRDTAAATDVGTISWDEGAAGSKAIIIPLLLINQNADRRFTMTVSQVGSSTPLSSQQILILGRGNANLNTIGFTADLRQFPQEIDTVVAFVERRGAGTGEATVQYRVEDGSTVVGLDYDVDDAVGTLSWADGELGAKTILVDMNQRNVFQPKAFTLRLTGTDVISTSAVQSVVVDPLTITLETAGQIQLDRTLINTTTDNGSITVKIQRAGGSQSQAVATVRTTLTDGSFSDRTLTWVAGDNADKTFTIPISEAGTITVEISTVSGALKSDQSLQINVDKGSSGGGGGGAFGKEVLAMLAIGLWMHRRRVRAMLEKVNA